MAKLAADRKAGTLDDLSAALVDQLQAEADTAFMAAIESEGPYLNTRWRRWRSWQPLIWNAAPT